MLPAVVLWAVLVVPRWALPVAVRWAHHVVVDSVAVVVAALAVAVADKLPLTHIINLFHL